MRVTLRFTETSTGRLVQELVTTVREWKADNPNEPAAWVIEKEIREYGTYRGSTFGDVTYALTRAPRQKKS